jgi:5-formyltetrahydrofolate cyclo-ligase
MVSLPVSAPNTEALASRQLLRQRLLDERQRFVSGAAAGPAQVALAKHLGALLHDIEPQCLGLYWPVRSEFNAVAALAADKAFADVARALPYARREPVDMQYRAWNGEEPTVRDECNIASSNGAPVVPDVVLVPCVGFTAQGHRLGYGGGYFDRWLALHPGVTAIGVAWSLGLVDMAAFEPQPHDVTLTLVVTERGVA